MLREGPDVFCFRCHGSSSTVEDAKEKGFLANNVEVADLRREFNKPYRHPVEMTGIRTRDEIIPQTNRSAERHAECVDCHHHHYASESNKITGVKGVNSQGMVVQKINSEYELCFKCHSYSANLPASQKNKADQFAISNPSYHPIVGQGKTTMSQVLYFPLLRQVL